MIAIVVDGKMLVITQAGEVGKTKYLLDMHRLRKRVFKDQLNWDVHVGGDDLEVDQFDLPDTVYVLAVNDEDRVIGNWRLLPSTGPTMIRDVWPFFLESVGMSTSPSAWECSRFAVDSLGSNAVQESRQATRELFCGVAELSVLCGIDTLYAMHDLSIARLAKSHGCIAEATSHPHRVGKHLTCVKSYRINKRILDHMKSVCGITQALVTLEMLPLVLQELRNTRVQSQFLTSANHDFSLSQVTSTM